MSLDAGGQKATLRTRPLRFTGENLLINVACRDGGSARIAILDDAGKPLPGFGLSDCKPITGDHVARLVQWQDKSDLTALRDKSVAIHIELTGASIYSFRFGRATP